jgi:Flp pilus assembly protein TadD
MAPNFAPAWNNLGIVLQEALKLDESRFALERALALEGDNPQTLNNLANTLKRLGLAAEADRRWTAALALKPDYAEAYSNLANLLLDQGEYDRAELSRELGFGRKESQKDLARVQAAVAARQFCNPSLLRARSVLRETRWR